MGLIAIRYQDLYLALFELGGDDDFLGAGRLDYDSVRFAVLVLEGSLYGAYLAELMSSRLDLDVLGLGFIVSWLDENSLGASFIMSGDPVTGIGVVVAVGEAEA